MKLNKITVLLLLSYFFISSCAVTHHKKNLIDFKTNKISESKLKLDGYFYHEYEMDINWENPPYPYEKYINETGIKKSKTLNAIFIYDDGFTYVLSGIDGINSYYCADGRIIENSYQNAHKNIKLMVEAQKSNDKKIRRRCDFEPDYINQKGLTEIVGNTIKIQYYQTEMQIPNKDSFNSYYLYEMSGIIENDTTFIINKIKSYRTENTKDVSYIYKFKKAQKPELQNYFKKHM
ncbi:hypothetical protein WFZ85_15745 [Flavobacterium sp. j3]|uniref:Lipoprotein n=1 Tax=Flavobacterium aureirubrum TaxID=3133147 RepID=A0ABU9N8N5_9FLAO